MAKAKSLIKSVKAMPKWSKTGPVPWLVRIAAENPELLEEVNELIDAHLDGDESLRLRLPTRYSLVKYLIREVGIAAGETTLKNYVNQRRADRGQKNTG